MRRPSEAINTTVLASAIRIDARFKANVGTLIARDNCLRRVAKIFCCPARLSRRLGIFIDNIDIGKIDMQLFETIGRTPGRAATVDSLMTLRRFLNNWDKFPPRHGECSREHIRLSSDFSVAAVYDRRN